MKAIQNFEDIENLKTDDRLIRLGGGCVFYYRFLCFHPRVKQYVILLDHCEQPVRLYCPMMYGCFYTDYTRREILEYQKDYALKEAKAIERSLATFEIL